MDLSKPVRTSAALKGGASRSTLAGRPIEHPYHGVVRERVEGGRSARGRIDDALPLLTQGAVLTGWAAAHYQGVRMLDGWDRRMQEQPITIATPEHGQLRRRPGIAPTRRTLHRNEVLILDDITIATIARAAYDMALDAPNVCEALVAIDMCASTVIRQSRTTLANIVNLIGNHRKTRGIEQARRAISLASSRSASPWETRTRYEAEIGAGINGLLVNVPVFDATGNLAGIADLLDAQAGLVIESDGSDHLKAAAHSDDNVREEDLEMLGLFVSRVTAIDHRDRKSLHDRLSRARLHAAMDKRKQTWTLDKPAWWWRWPPSRRWT